MRKRAAFTLVEMALVLSLTALIIGVLTVVYGYSMERLAHATADYSASDDAFLSTDIIAKTVSNACVCATVTSGSVTALKCTMPSTGTDKDGDGYLDTFTPATVSRRGYEQFTRGKRVWYYLSDSTGAFGNVGTILWRAQRTDDLNPTNSDIDTKFPYTSSTHLKFPLLISLAFTVNSAAQTVTITTVAGSLVRDSRTPGTEGTDKSYKHTESRTVFWRNWRQ